MPTFVQGFLFPILLCRDTGDHPQEEIANFGYRLERRVYNLKILLYFGNLMGTNDFFFPNFFDVASLSNIPRAMS